MARSDVQLMLDVKSGDDSSFELLLRKYRAPVVNFLYRMVRNTAAAEDLTQEVFLRVYRARGQYLPTAKFTTWMFRIATNLALNALRDGRYRQQEVSIDRSAFDRSADGESEQPALEIADRQPSMHQFLPGPSAFISNNVDLTFLLSDNSDPVPEPGTLTLLSTGLFLALGLYRRKR